MITYEEFYNINLRFCGICFMWKIQLRQIFFFVTEMDRKRIEFAC